MKGTRREFFGQSGKLVASGIAGSMMLTRVAGGKTATTTPTTTQAADKDAIEMRTLGRTKLKVSVLTAGTGSTNADVLRYAMDSGINFVHTAPNYSGGKSIAEVGKALKGRKDKDKIVIGLKMTWKLSSDEEFDKALKTLGRKHVDILFFPRHRPDQVSDKRLRDAFLRWHKQGKARFMGLTSHGAMEKCLQAALATGWYDCLMPAYTLSKRKGFLKIFEACQKQKIGLVAIKTGISPGKASAVPVLLRDKALTTICRTLSKLREVKSYIEASRKKVKQAQADRLIELAEVAAVGRCEMCGRCTEACPNGLAVNDLVRSVDYYVDRMKDYQAGKQAYAEIDSVANATNCLDCGQCEKVCPNRVPVRHFVYRSREMFS